MKFINYLFIISIATIMLVSCGDDDWYYHGNQIASVDATSSILYVQPEGENVYNISIALSKPAESDLTIPVTVLKNTGIADARYTVSDISGNKINVSIPRGNTLGLIQVKADFSKYDAEVDTLIVKLDDPLLGKTGFTADVLDSAALIIRRHCPVTMDEIRSTWVGTYVEIGDDSYTMQVTFEEPNMLKFTNFWGEGNDVRFEINLDVIPYQTRVVDNELLGMGGYGRELLRSTDSNGVAQRGTLDNCEETISFRFGIQLPDYPAWYTGVFGFSARKQ